MANKKNAAKNTDYRLSFLGWKPSEKVRGAEPVPVTLLSGFLGSGKTTLLKHLLEKKPGARFGLVINDVGAVNVDAEDLRRNFPEDDNTVQLLSELTQGCICCSIDNELADAMVYLLEESHPSHILIEASGVANPRNVLQSFYAENFAGHSLEEAFRIANMVTVVDSPALLREWTTGTTDRGRRRRIFLNDPRKPYLELIMEQIETCDVMVLNKMDHLTDAEAQEVMDLVESLNPRAERIGAVHGRIDPSRLLDHARFDLQETQKGSLVHMKLLSDDSDNEVHQKQHHGHQGYGLTTAFFRARQPVDPEKFFATLRSGLPGLVRAKGFYWTEDRPDQCGVLSLAGGVLRADWGGPWFITMLNQGHVSMDNMPNDVRRAWLKPPCGDRRQEIVLIGVGIKQEEIEARLKACLVSTGEPVPREKITMKKTTSLLEINANRRTS